MFNQIERESLDGEAEFLWHYHQNLSHYQFLNEPKQERNDMWEVLPQTSIKNQIFPKWRLGFLSFFRKRSMYARNPPE